MNLAKRTVLIVEDDYFVYDELADFFETKGFRIIKTDNEKAIDSYDEAILALRNDEPDIAIIDININGKKDGLELGAYLREHFNSLVIIFSGYHSYENIERAKRIMADGFVIKAEKPIDLEQLWATVDLRLPNFEIRQKRKTLGTRLKVREIEIKNAPSATQKDKAEKEYIDIETFVRWENITYIESYNAKNAGEGNNNLLLHTTTLNKAYVYRSNMGEIMVKLPHNFVRFDQATIVNLHHVTAKGRGNNLYFIDKKPFKITDTYREQASEIIQLILG